MPELELTEPQFQLTDDFPRLSRYDLDLTIQYYARVYDLYKTEAALLYHYEDSEEKYYTLSPPWYAANGGHVEYAGMFHCFCPSCQILQTQQVDTCPVCGGTDMRKFQYMGQSHSHGSGGAFTSGDDDANEEVISGFKFTVGKVDKLAAEIYPSFVIAVDGFVNKERRGKRFLTRLDELVDMGFPEGLQLQVRHWLLNVAAPEKARVMRHMTVVDHPTFGGGMDAIQFMSPEPEKAARYCELTKVDPKLIMSSTQWVDALTKRKAEAAKQSNHRWTSGSNKLVASTSVPSKPGPNSKASVPSTPPKKPTTSSEFVWDQPNEAYNPFTGKSNKTGALKRSNQSGRPSMPSDDVNRNRILVGVIESWPVYADTSHGFNADTSLLDLVLQDDRDTNYHTAQELVEVLLNVAAFCTWSIVEMTDEDGDGNDMADAMMDCDSIIDPIAQAYGVNTYEIADGVEELVFATLDCMEADYAEGRLLGLLILLSEALAHLCEPIDNGEGPKPGSADYATAVEKSVISNTLPLLNTLASNVLFDIAYIVERMYSEGIQCRTSQSSVAGAPATT